MTLGGSLREYIFKTEIVILWKTDNPVSITHFGWKEQGLFVKIKSMQLEFSRYLKHTGCLMRVRFVKSKTSSSTQALKSPRSTIFSYFAEDMSNDLLMISRCLPMLLLWEL